MKWDLIILDEGQRIKNWEAKTSRVIKGLRSRFALVLSGTPLENRLDELYSVVQFIDDRRLGPGFRFFNQHRVVDEKGKVLGYKNLDELRENLQPVLLRRTRAVVRQQLPARTNEIVRIPPTDEQLDLHDSHMQIVMQITAQEVPHRDGPAAAAEAPAHVPHVRRQHVPGRQAGAGLLDEAGATGRACSTGCFREEGRKVVLFSEWTTMLDLIEPLLKKRRLPFVRLDGSVPQKQRQELVHEFQTNPRLPAVPHDERRLDRTESAGGEHGDQRRSAVEPGRAGAADRPRPPHGPEAAGAGVRPGHRRDDRRETAQHAFGEARFGPCRPGRGERRGSSEA